jgi:hypothetical protein
MLASCKHEVDFTREILSLDSLQQVIRAEKADVEHFASIPSDSIALELKYIQENFVGKMKEKMALVLADYSMMQLKNDALNKQRRLLLDNGQTINDQCNSLQQALREKATHDALKNELNASYVCIALQQEKKLAGDWMNQTKTWKTSLIELKQQYDFQQPIVRHWIDSIPQRTK